ncbi:hypothetical protein TYRP_014682 [Tyrophagus putrescentiae]|nr:hypothetical protein TYRP_014682 [Tyrophagus putrescentiae]
MSSWSMVWVDDGCAGWKGMGFCKELPVLAAVVVTTIEPQGTTAQQLFHFARKGLGQRMLSGDGRLFK